MPRFFAELLRGVAYRDNNFKNLNDNDPTVGAVNWTKGVGVTATSDGDILTINGTTTGGSSFVSPGVPPIGTFAVNGISTTTYPYVIIRASGTGTFRSRVIFDDSSTRTDTFTLVSGYKTFVTAAMPTGRSYNQPEIDGQSNANLKVDYYAICKQPPVQLSQQDLEFGTVTRAAFGFDHAELRLNNKRGKFVTGSNSFTFGDHIHIYLPRQFDPTGSLYHAYGGYAEIQEPFQPNDEINVNSRGWGLAAGRALHLAQYQNAFAATIINDMVDNSINAASKNGIPLKSNYQLTRSFVQSFAAALGVYVTTMKPVFDSWREIADLVTATLSPAAFFVDPAENIHWVPLGGQGTANWATDPIPANYAQLLAVGKNQIINSFRRDTQSVRTRVHYIGVAQAPGVLDTWTENTASSWGSERLVSPTTATFTDVSSPRVIGAKAVKCQLQNNSASHYGGAMFYPSAKNLHLNIANMGSPYSPPLFDMFFRVNQGANPKVTPLGKSPSIFFANDATNRFVYNLISDGNTVPGQSIMNLQGINTGPTDDLWYHLIIPIGPNGGTLFLNNPSVNGLATASYTGGSEFANVGSNPDVGTPHWDDINYIGVYWEDNGGAPPTGGSPFYFDGWRIIGGRYRIAYDNRSVPPRYPDMSEIMVWDPISKDDAMIKNLAAAELFRLRNAILRGSVHVPIIGDVNPEQQVQITAPSANLSSTYLRITEVIHRFSPNGMVTELSLSDDFTNSQPLERFKILNSLMGMGENAILSREVYDLKTALVQPGFTPALDPYT